MAKDFLTGAELTSDELLGILDRAAELKANRQVIDVLHGHTVALIFERPSTRTRMSAEIAVNELGGHPMVLSGEAMQLSRGESLRDTALVMERFVHAIGIRTGPHETVETLAEHASIPVFNLLTEDHHPCQALADLLTLLERFGDLAGRRIAYVGDGNNVTASLMILGAMAGVSVSVATPEGFEPDQDAIQLAVKVAKNGAQIELTHDPLEAAAAADAIYTDVWVSMGDEDSEQRKAKLQPYQLNMALLDAAKPDAIALHCLPAHVGEEITDDALYGERSAVFDQAENRLHVQKALLEHLLAP
ncbi:MAG TPA: ornithine carbamoyltransferase [Solirubrobacterales bacterium]|nr:ornithine carbamoyltransferase [Solirubrobacterales bacterium]